MLLIDDDDELDELRDTILLKPDEVDEDEIVVIKLDEVDVLDNEINDEMHIGNIIDDEDDERDEFDVMIHPQRSDEMDEYDVN